MSKAIVVTKNNIPFWLEGSGDLTVSLPALTPEGALPRGAGDLLDLDFSGADDFVFGSRQSIKIAVKTGTRLKLQPLWGSDEDVEVLRAFDLQNYFERHPTDVMLLFDSAADGAAALSSGVRHGPLSTKLTLELGAQARYRYLRPSPGSTPANELISEFFEGFSLPVSIRKPLKPGEVIAFEYGGRLALGAEIGLGYKVNGSPSFEIGELELSEVYNLSVLAGVQFGAEMTGHFGVEVRGDEELGGDWVRVVVRKAHARGIKIAASVEVKGDGQLRGLPDTPDEFLGAALGVNAKNWLNMLSEVEEWSDFEALDDRLDGLAEEFIRKWTGRAFEELEDVNEFVAFRNRVRSVVDIYDGVEDRAISLFDGYFNQLDVLTAKLDKIVSWTSWDQFQGKVDDNLWMIVHQLTDGDPFSFSTGVIEIDDGANGRRQILSLPELVRRAEHARDFVRSEAHEEIRNIVKVAKESFSIDKLMTGLDVVGSPKKLKKLANDEAGKITALFIDRLLGGLEDVGADEGFKRVNKVIKVWRKFEEGLYAKLLDAAQHSFRFSLYAQYNRSRAGSKLVDISINLATVQGADLMQQAGHGNFVPALQNVNSDLVRIHEVVFKTTLSRESSFNINIEGWHRKWFYSGFDKVLVDLEQRVQSAGNGGVVVFSNAELQVEKERRTGGSRDQERVYTNFLLRLVGESNRNLTGRTPAFDAKQKQYLIDVITGYVATYQLLFEDSRTSVAELDYYLSFAKDFGLDRAGATIETLHAIVDPKKERPNTDLGSVKADYHVRYTAESLRKLANSNFDERVVRSIMRKLVLSNFAARGELSELRDIGWAYWTPGVRDLWRRGQPPFHNITSPREVKPISKSPYSGLKSPSTVTLQPNSFRVLDSLFRIEESLVGSLSHLHALVNSPARITQADLGEALLDVGKALKQFDSMDHGPNTVFAVFDALIRQVDPTPQARVSSLEFTSQVEEENPETHETEIFRVARLFTSDALEADDGLPHSRRQSA